MKEFDLWLQNSGFYFIRYSDDLLVLGKSEEELSRLLTEIKQRLYQLKLEINEKKTCIVSLPEGFEFLGHAFDQTGRTVPAKAKEQLDERIETVWLTTKGTVEEKLEKIAQIITGWEQYFRDDRKIGSILEYACLLERYRTNESRKTLLQKHRRQFHNPYRDLAIYLGRLWQEEAEKNISNIIETGETSKAVEAAERYKKELFEYEDFFELPEPQKAEGEIRTESLKFLCTLYRQFLVMGTTDTATELMQTYSDLHQYANASCWMEIRNRENLSDSASQPSSPGPSTCCMETALVQTPPASDQSKISASRLMKHFAGREDIYGLETLGYGNKRQTEIQLMPLTETLVKEHLSGAKTIGTYIQRPNNTVHFLVIDIDISKKILLSYPPSSPEFQSYLSRAYTYTREIRKECRHLGLEGYIEYSGCRGYHLWILFTEWIPVRYVNMFCDLLDQKIPKDPDLTIEYFPNKTKVKEGKYGQVLKLPCGVHSRTGEYSYFLDDQGEKIPDLTAFFDSIAKFPLTAIKKILAVNTGLQEKTIQNVDTNLEPFGKLPANVEEILNNCNLMRHLCQKARTTGYLAHFERLSILYVFGHLGKEGQDFVHQIMSYTLNYQYNTTERFIRKLPDKPISCVKLREQYKNITAEFGCSCTFKRSKNCYPSPVLHAIALSNDQQNEITIPTSKTLTKEKEQQVMEELNIHKKAQELAGKILEMKKQQRRLTASISKTETELSKIYDDQNIECLEIEMGLLVRRKKENGSYEWYIEI